MLLCFPVAAAVAAAPPPAAAEPPPAGFRCLLLHVNHRAVAIYCNLLSPNAAFGPAAPDGDTRPLGTTLLGPDAQTALEGIDIDLMTYILTSLGFNTVADWFKAELESKKLILHPRVVQFLNNRLSGAQDGMS